MAQPDRQAIRLERGPVRERSRRSRSAAFLVERGLDGPSDNEPGGRPERGQPDRGQNGRRDWRRWLAGGSPREILARIVPGDPLGVRVLVGRRLREEALLLDADRAHLRALAHCARYAARYEGRPAIESWLALQIDAAIEELGREELPPASRERASAIEDLSKPLGLQPVAMHRACRAFNRQDPSERKAFFALLIGSALRDITRASVSAEPRRATRTPTFESAPSIDPCLPSAGRS
jgi:hypothetical protein